MAVVLGILPEADPSPPGSRIRTSRRLVSPPCSSRVRCSASRTAVYRPVCTVVWEGRSREAPPIPIYDPLLNLEGHALAFKAGAPGANPDVCKGPGTQYREEVNKESIVLDSSLKRSFS